MRPTTTAAVIAVTLAGVAALLLAFDPFAPASAEPMKPVFDGADADRARIAVRLERVAEGFERPTDVQPVPGRPGTLIVLEKAGVARWLELDGGRTGAWFRLDVPTRSEQGLLGLAFHPRFEANGRFFVHYTAVVAGQNTSRIAEWRAQPGKPIADAAPREVRAVLEVAQPFVNHNAGQLAFGPDGALYVGLGDGGAANDPKGHGQDRSTLLGAMLRLDVDAGGDKPYAIPPDNPFAGPRAVEGVRPEIWAWGLRNPWRYTFAPDGRLVVADVGQNRYEEVTLVAAGENHGWNAREGAHCFPSGEVCTDGPYVTPIWEYPRGEGISITGGPVYTGDAIEGLRGRYVFGDYGSGRMWALTLPPPGAKKALQPESALAALGRWPIRPSTFGVDHRGEIYVADFDGGGLYRIAVASD